MFTSWGHNCYITVTTTELTIPTQSDSKFVRFRSDGRGDATDAGAAQVPVLVVVVVVESHPRARRLYPLHGVLGPLEDEDDLVGVRVRVRVGARARVRARVRVRVRGRGRRLCSPTRRCWSLSRLGPEVRVRGYG